MLLPRKSFLSALVFLLSPTGALQATQINTNCLINRKEPVPDYWDALPYQHLTHNADGSIRFTREFLLEKLDDVVVHGIIRKQGPHWIEIESVVDDETKIDVARGVIDTRRALYRINVDAKTLLDDRQKYPEFAPRGAAPSWQCLSAFKPGTIVIAYSQNEKKILRLKQWTASRISIQYEGYRKLITPFFSKHGISLN